MPWFSIGVHERPAGMGREWKLLWSKNGAARILRIFTPSVKRRTTYASTAHGLDAPHSFDWQTADGPEQTFYVSVSWKEARKKYEFLITARVRDPLSNPWAYRICMPFLKESSHFIYMQE